MAKRKVRKSNQKPIRQNRPGWRRVNGKWQKVLNHGRRKEEKI